MPANTFAAFYNLRTREELDSLLREQFLLLPNFLNQNYMEPYCATVCLQMQQKINQCKNANTLSFKEIECCFQAAFQGWNSVKQKLRNYYFQSEAKEIEFFRTIKPKFTSEIEYFGLLYHCVLFQPKDCSRAIDFLAREGKRLEKFEAENTSFIRCFEEGTELLAYYFLRKHYVVANMLDQKLYDADTGAITNGDHLAASLLALRRYQFFVQDRLGRIPV